MNYLLHFRVDQIYKPKTLYFLYKINHLFYKLLMKINQIFIYEIFNFFIYMDKF